MVKETWSKDQQGGWGGIALKNKLRNLKNTNKQGREMVFSPNNERERERVR